MNTALQEISSSSYRCDCGCVAHFPETDLWQTRERSYAGRQWISDGAGIEQHILVLEDGQITGLLCPRDVQREDLSPRQAGVRGRYMAVAAVVAGICTFIVFLSSLRM